MDLDQHPLARLAIAALLGLLVGLQRERTAPALAGFRTFPLVTLLGGALTLLGGPDYVWPLSAGLLAVAALAALNNLLRSRTDQPFDPGLTSEIALLLMYGVGALVTLGYTQLGVVLTGGIALLLQAKHQLHAFAGRLDDRDTRAIMQFVLLSLVILPVVPSEPLGPYDAIDPREVWLMVVLVVGINLGGYLLYRFLGERVGLLLGGVLGGLISSTATTASYGRRAHGARALVPLAAVVILIASSIVYLRVLVEIAVASPTLLPTAAWPIGGLFAVSALIVLLMFRRLRGSEPELPEQKNPTELGAAFVFAALYALVTLALEASRDWFGAEGLYVVSLLSGLTDVDAITLSTAQMHSRGQLDASQAWRLVVVAAASNLAFKAALAGALGGAALFARVGGAALVVIGASVGLVLLY